MTRPRILFAIASFFLYLTVWPGEFDINFRKATAVCMIIFLIAICWFLDAFRGPKGDDGLTGPQGPSGKDGKEGMSAFGVDLLHTEVRVSDIVLPESFDDYREHCKKHSNNDYTSLAEVKEVIGSTMICRRIINRTEEGTFAYFYVVGNKTERNTFGHPFFLTRYKSEPIKLDNYSMYKFIQDAREKGKM